jgi:type III pantothenate kinase
VFKAVETAILDVDIGNTRIKWRLLSRQDEISGALYTSDIDSLDAHIGVSVSRVRVSCVASASLREHVRQLAVSRWDCEPEFASASAQLAGVRNGYDNPLSLGVDRWLAIVAAFNACRSPCLVLDAGSALTVDIVNENGLFEGGYITPGLAMMQCSLVENTGNIRCEVVDDFSLRGDRLGTNTQDAVRLGAAFALRAIAERSVGKFRLRWPHGRIYITGGDGEKLAASLDLLECLDVMLVFKGLALALP